MTVYRNDNQHPCPNARGQLPVACDGVLLLKEFEREIYVYVYIFFPAAESRTRAAPCTASGQICTFRLKIRQDIAAIQAGRHRC